MDHYQGGQWNDGDSNDTRGASSILPSFDSDVESDTDSNRDEHSKRIQEINTTYHSSPKMIVIGGYVDPSSGDRSNRINNSKKGELIVDVHILNLDTHTWSTPNLLPSVDDRWKKIDYEYFASLIHSLAVEEMQISSKKRSARSSIIGALSGGGKGSNSKLEDSGELVGPSSDLLLKMLKLSSSNDVNNSFLKLYPPLKNLCNSNTVQSRVVENVKKGQLESFIRSIKTNALDVQLEKNNGLPSFQPFSRSRFGACALGHDTILMFGGRFKDTLESSCLWSLRPWWKGTEHNSRLITGGSNDGIRSFGNSSSNSSHVDSGSDNARDSFYSTESEGYSTDGGYYTSGAEEDDD